jgi:hypothetical protein
LNILLLLVGEEVELVEVVQEALEQAQQQHFLFQLITRLQ